MTRCSLILVLAFFAALAILGIYNHELTLIKVPFAASYQIPKIALILFSSITGGLLIILLYTLRDTRRFISNYQSQKKQRKDEHIGGLYSRALAGILANDPEEARLALEEIIAEEPGHVDSLLRLGEIASKAGRPEKAIEHFRKALDLSADRNKRLEALLLLEGQMESLKRSQDALFYIEEILKIDPDNLSALNKKCLILERMGKWAELVEVQKSVLRHPHLASPAAEEAKLHGYKYELAREDLEAGRLENAGKVFRSVIKYDNMFVPAYLGAAEVLLSQNHTEEAIDFLEKGYAETGSLVVLARLEDLLISLGNPDRIIIIYDRAIAGSQKQDNASLKFMLGKLYYRLEMVDDALETLTGIESADSYPLFYSLLGELYMRREAYERAAKSFRKAIDMKPWMLSYSCSSCGHSAPEWAGRCAGCGLWNTYTFDIHARARV
jgi:tetratricopeptide (TPR) repeat protein